MVNNTDDQTLKVESRRWIKVQFCLNLLKYMVCNVLRIMFYIAACVIYKCSILFDILTEKLGTTEISEDLLKHIKQRFNDYSFDFWEQIAKQKKTNKVNPDTASESLQVKGGNFCSYDGTNKNEETNKVIADTANESLQEQFDDGCSNIFKNKPGETCKIIVDTPKTQIRALLASRYYSNTKSQKPKSFVCKETVDKKSEYSEVCEENTPYNSDLDVSEKNVEQISDIQVTQDKPVHSNNITIRRKLSKYARKHFLDYSAINLTQNSIKNTEENHRHDLPLKLNIEKLNLIELNTDICNLSKEYSIVHYVNEDIQLFMTSNFKFNHDIGDLMDQHLKIGSCGEMVQNEQYVFYLVINRSYGRKTFVMKDLEQSFYNLLDKMKKHELTKLAIPKLGIDSQTWLNVKKTISKVFTGTKIEITICLKSSKGNLVQHFVPRLHRTSIQLWEMQPQTDLIILINMEKIYLDNWKDKVVDKIDAKYPFKDRLLKDIKFKPLKHGDMFSYTVNKEELFCIFIQPFEKNPFFYKCIEKAFKKMKLQMPGYRYLAIQRGSIYSKSYNIIHHCLALLQSIFDHRYAEIWLCGDPYNQKQNQYIQFNKIVRTTIELNKKEQAKINSSSLKNEKKKYNIDKNHSKNEVEKNQGIEKLQDNTLTPIVKENTNTDNYERENWDDHYV